MTEQNIKIAEVLEKAATLLETKGWTQRNFAVDKDGEPVAVNSEKACAYCIVGAIRKAIAERLPSEYSKARDLYLDLFPKATESIWDVTGTHPILWQDQDGRTAEEVISKLRQVAQQLRTDQ